MTQPYGPNNRNLPPQAGQTAPTPVNWPSVIGRVPLGNMVHIPNRARVSLQDLVQQEYATRTAQSVNAAEQILADQIAGQRESFRNAVQSHELGTYFAEFQHDADVVAQAIVQSGYPATTEAKVFTGGKGRVWNERVKYPLWQLEGNKIESHIKAFKNTNDNIYLVPWQSPDGRITGRFVTRHGASKQMVEYGANQFGMSDHMQEHVSSSGARDLHFDEPWQIYEANLTYQPKEKKGGNAGIDAILMARRSLASIMADIQMGPGQQQPVGPQYPQNPYAPGGYPGPQGPMAPQGPWGAPQPAPAPGYYGAPYAQPAPGPWGQPGGYNGGDPYGGGYGPAAPMGPAPGPAGPAPGAGGPGGGEGAPGQ